MAKQPRNKAPRPTDEQVREAVLEFMFQQYRKSRAVDPGRLKISQIKKALKSQGFTEQEIVTNLEYLVQTEWVVREEVQYPIARGGRSVMATQPYFKLSHKAIDYKSGPSRFQKIERFEGINVSAVRSVVVIGGNNVVNASYVELFGALGNLSDAIKANDKLSEEQKLNLQAEIETIKSQLAKAEPDRSTVEKSWSVLKGVATLEGVASAVARVAPLIASLLGG